jgi:preprotein translocase subunit YajC
MANYKFPTIFILVHKFTFVYFLVPKSERRERNSSENNKEWESY